MLTDILIPSGVALQVISSSITPECIRVELTTTAPTVPCTACHTSAHRVHSRYQRTLADLPLAQLPVRLQLHVRRFNCDNPACSHKTFSETVPDMIIPSARRTVRLTTEQRQLGLEVGGEVGARTAKRQGMPVSAATILRLVRHKPPADCSTRPTPAKIGVDDFAFRKGQRYGTILVDLETHRPVDLLPDRTAATWEKWLREHPGIELIARDRASDYADGAARGAPDAVQVADRFHLCQNVREMLQRLLERHQAALRAATRADMATDVSSSHPPVPLVAEVCEVCEIETAGVPGAQGTQLVVEVGANTADAMPTIAPVGPVSSAPVSSAPVLSTEPAVSISLTTVATQSQRRRARRLQQYKAVRELHAEGYSMREISIQLQLGRNTVRRFAVADEFPERATRRVVHSKLDPFVSYLTQQMGAGQDNGMELWRQLRDQHGYTGSRALVSSWVAHHRHLCPVSKPDAKAAKSRRRGAPPRPVHERPRPSQRRCSARQAAFLLIRQSENLDDVDAGLVERLCAQHPELQLARHLSGEFLMMVRDRRGERLEEWLIRAEESDIPEIRSFVAGIRRDKAAVFAGLTLADSSGQVEGQVNRLKFIKRSGYGRANFDLLRHRVLVT